MRIDIQTAEVDSPTASAEEYLRGKLPKLERFYDQIMDTIAYLSEERTERKVELKVNVRDTTLFCNESGETFEEAIDKALDVMTRQLKKYKEKHR
jgi:putative sigma-54 modulation protein